MGRPRLDARRLEEAEPAEVALGLGEDFRVEGLALVEQEEPPDDRGLRLDVDRVRRAVDPPLLLFFRREDVEALDPDLPDPEGLLGAREAGREREGEEGSPGQVPSSQDVM